MNRLQTISHDRHGNVGDSRTRKLYEMYNSSAIVSAARLLPQNGQVLNKHHAEKWDRSVQKMTSGSLIMIPCKVSVTGWKYVSPVQLEKMNEEKDIRQGKFIPPTNINVIASRSPSLNKRDYDDMV